MMDEGPHTYFTARRSMMTKPKNMSMENSAWRLWGHVKPEPGQKIAVAYSDGSGGFLALAIDYDGEGTIDLLDAEDGMSLLFYPGEERPNRMDGDLWCPLPQDFPLCFMEAHNDY